MTEYSYSDLVKMQDQAIRRVREMQERARMTVRENPIPDIEAHTPSEELSAKQSPTRTENERNRKPSERPPKPPEKPHCEKPKPPHSIDADRAILLPLIMLLNEEGADKMLLLALLYILA